jgi:hypothetical protein
MENRMENMLIGIGVAQAQTVDSDNWHFSRQNDTKVLKNQKFGSSGFPQNFGRTAKFCKRSNRLIITEPLMVVYSHNGPLKLS